MAGAQLAYRLVDTALQNFLEQRHSTEVSTIAETIAILEGHASQPEGGHRHRRGKTSSRTQAALAAAASMPRPPQARPRQEALKTADRRGEGHARRQEAGHQGARRFPAHRRLVELQADLAQQRAVYADAHPAVAQLLQSIGALQELAAVAGAPNGGARAAGRYERLSLAEARAAWAGAER